MKKLISILPIILVLLSSFAGQTFADDYGVSNYGSNCNSSYGGSNYSGSSCSVSTISINKLVQNPKSKQYVENLALTDPNYAPNQIVPFQINITNTGNTSLTNVKVVDSFPQYTTFAGGQGSYNQSQNTDTITVGSLNPNQSESIMVDGKVGDTNTLPQNQSQFCLVNEASVTADNIPSSTANSQFCVTQQISGVTTKGGLEVASPTTISKTPGTGPEALPLLALLPTGLLGALLRRKTK